MHAPDSLAGLAADLRALPARERRAILRSLSGFERTKATALLRQEKRRRLPQSEAPASPRSSFSPWVAALVDEARSESVTPATASLTPATRKLLRELAEEVAPPMPVPPTRARPGPSLLGAVASVLFAGWAV